MPRSVRTELPADGVFRFTAVARREGPAAKGGLRVTIPGPVVRGLEHVGWPGAWLRVQLAGGAPFRARARRANVRQHVLALPLEQRGVVAVGEMVQVAVWYPRRA